MCKYSLNCIRYTRSYRLNLLSSFLNQGSATCSLERLQSIHGSSTSTKRKLCAYSPLRSPVNGLHISIESIATKRGISMAQVSLAWSLSKDFMTAPIVGTTSIEKLKDSIGEFKTFALIYIQLTCHP